MLVKRAEASREALPGGIPATFKVALAAQAEQHAFTWNVWHTLMRTGETNAGKPGVQPMGMLALKRNEFSVSEKGSCSTTLGYASESPFVSCHTEECRAACSQCMAQFVDILASMGQVASTPIATQHCKAGSARPCLDLDSLAALAERGIVAVDEELHVKVAAVHEHPNVPRHKQHHLRGGGGDPH
jgi:hypothetical protein